MEKGSRVVVVFQLGFQKYPRKTIGTFLGYGEGPIEGKSIVLSLRPTAGTTAIPMENVLEFRKVPMGTPVVINKMVKVKK